MAGSPTKDLNKSSAPYSPFRWLIAYYKDTATVHGVAHVGGLPLYGFRRCFWMVLMLLMLTALTSLMCIHFLRYTSYPYITVVNAYTFSTLPFPAVTICNLNQYHHDRIPNDPRLRELLFMLSGLTNMQSFLDREDDIEYGNTVKPRVKVETGEELRDFAMNAAHTLSDMFLYCVWRGQNHSCEELFNVTVTDIGVCFTFNAPSDHGSRLNASDSGRFGGLSVIMNIEQDFYYYSMFTQSGIKVLLHEPGEAPLLVARGFFVRPGTSTDVVVRKEQRTSLTDPYKALIDGYCLDTLSPDFRSPLTRFQNYSYSEAACWRECFISRMVELCGCRHFYDPGNTSLGFGKSCGCMVPCTEVSYITSLSFTDFASRFAVQHLFQAKFVPDKDFVRENLIELRVYFDVLTVAEIKQQPEMTVMTILGNMGGHMGLCLGASILSLTEVIEVLVLLLVSYVTAWCRPLQPPKVVAMGDSTTIDCPTSDGRGSDTKELTDSAM